jgi:pantoate--beta-alanine ligase
MPDKPVKILRSPSSAARVCRSLPKPLVLVPTMGALHEGHLTLIHKARKLAGAHGSVIVSLFVNPKQFGPKEDFSKYPRPFAEDTAKCRKAGVDVVFAPLSAELYAPDFSTWVDESVLSGGLCGAARPGHFRGVCTVVSKLFHITGADIGVFGKKDAQQLAVIRRMVRDLDFQIKIVGVETFREPDGLALSSRNRFLSAEERAQAPVLRRALLAARQSLKTGAIKPGDLPTALAGAVKETIKSAPLAKVDYVEAVDAETLGVPSPETRRLLIAVAVYFGPTRLIDNLEVEI